MAGSCYQVNQGMMAHRTHQEVPAQGEVVHLGNRRVEVQEAPHNPQEPQGRKEAHLGTQEDYPGRASHHIRQVPQGTAVPHQGKQEDCWSAHQGMKVHQGTTDRRHLKEEIQEGVHMKESIPHAEAADEAADGELEDSRTMTSAVDLMGVRMSTLNHYQHNTKQPALSWVEVHLLHANASGSLLLDSRQQHQGHPLNDQPPARTGAALEKIPARSARGDFGTDALPPLRKIHQPQAVHLHLQCGCSGGSEQSSLRDAG